MGRFGVVVLGKRIIREEHVLFMKMAMIWTLIPFKSLFTLARSCATDQLFFFFFKKIKNMLIKSMGKICRQFCIGIPRGADRIYQQILVGQSSAHGYLTRRQMAQPNKKTNKRHCALLAPTITALSFDLHGVSVVPRAAARRLSTRSKHWRRHLV